MAIKIKEILESLDYAIMHTGIMMLSLFTGAYAQMVRPDFFPGALEAFAVVILMVVYTFCRMIYDGHKERKETKKQNKV